MGGKGSAASAVETPAGRSPYSDLRLLQEVADLKPWVTLGRSPLIGAHQRYLRILPMMGPVRLRSMEGGDQWAIALNRRSSALSADTSYDGSGALAQHGRGRSPLIVAIELAWDGALCFANGTLWESCGGHSSRYVGCAYDGTDMAVKHINSHEVYRLNQRNVAILIFDDVEVLDFCGPFEVFSVTGKRDGSDPFNVYTVAERSPVVARNHLTVIPQYTFDTCPQPDILVVPGGGGRRPDGTPFGTRREMDNAVLLQWINHLYPNTEHVLSVCTGALILAKAGLAENIAATTHHMAFEELRRVAPNTEIREGERVVDSGKVIFSGGISAGIDAAFYLVAKLLGQATALETATYMEYDWTPEQLPVAP